MQTFKTVTKTVTEKNDSVHTDAVYDLMKNAQKKVANLMLDYDATGSEYYVHATKILASLVETYYAYANDDDYISIAEVMEAFNVLTYYDEKHLYDDLVKNTAFEKVDFYEYCSLCN
tara:strand:+ start:735 stop:1085 length:351 start_codon:yes stop_codon:yes gene_type:complete